MNGRADKLYGVLIETYGDLDDALELFEALIGDFPEADDQELVDYVTEVAVENNDELPHLDDAVADFAASFSRKV